MTVLTFSPALFSHHLVITISIWVFLIYCIYHPWKGFVPRYLLLIRSFSYFFFFIFLLTLLLDLLCLFQLGITYFFQHNELGHLPYMAVALIPRAQVQIILGDRLISDWTSPGAGLHFGRPCCRGADLAECVSVPGDFLRPQGPFPPGYYSLRGGWVNRPASEAPLIRGMPTEL